MLEEAQSCDRYDSESATWNGLHHGTKEFLTFSRSIKSSAPEQALFHAFASLLSEGSTHLSSSVMPWSSAMTFSRSAEIARSPLGQLAGAAASSVWRDAHKFWVWQEAKFYVR